MKEALKALGWIYETNTGKTITNKRLIALKNSKDGDDTADPGQENNEASKGLSDVNDEGDAQEHDLLEFYDMAVERHLRERKKKEEGSSNRGSAVIKAENAGANENNEELTEKEKKAKEINDKITKQVFKDEDQKKRSIVWRNLKLFMKDKYFRRTTLACCYSTFVANFCWYGAVYAYAQIMGHQQSALKKNAVSDAAHFSLDASQLSAGMNLMLGAVAELPAMIFLYYIGTKYPRKSTIIAACIAVIIATLTFLVGDAMIKVGHGAEAGSYSASTMAFASFLYEFGFFANKFMTVIIFMMIYVYVAEVYPTKMRSTGVGICLSVGRLGAILSQPAYENLVNAELHVPWAPAEGKLTEFQKRDNAATYFFILSIVCVVGQIVIFKCVKLKETWKLDLL